MYKKFIIIIVFIFFKSFSQNHNKAIEIYKKRMINGGEKTLKELYIKLDEAKTNKEKLLIQSLISVTCIYVNDYNLVNKNINLSKQYLPDNEIDIEYGFYAYSLARYYSILGKENLSKHYYYKALLSFKKNRRWDFASEVAVNIAYGRPIQEEKYYLKAIDFSLKSKDISSIVYAKIAYATHIKEEYQHKKRNISIDKVLENYQNVILYVKDEAKIDNKFSLASVYINYGFTLFEFYPKHDKIHYYLDKGHEISKKYKLHNLYINYYGIKSDILFYEGKVEEAKNLYLSGLSYAKTMDPITKELQLELYNSLKNVSEKEKNWKSYYEYDKEYKKLNKIVFNEKISNNLQNILSAEEIKDNEDEIKFLNKTNNFKRIIILITFFLVFLLSYVAFLQFKSIKIQKKIALEREFNILKERDKINKDLLSTILQIEKKNQILNELKSELKNNNHIVDKKIFKIIEKALVIDEDFENFRTNFESIYPDFFEKLQLRANGKLTQLDLRYLAFFLMKMPNKEIAKQMSVDTKSIRMSKYRLKQKLNLSKSEDLDSYIGNL